MHFRWTVKSYQLLRPALGHRSAMFISDMLPVALFVGVPIILFSLFFYFVPVREDGSERQTCGSGPGQYDC